MNAYTPNDRRGMQIVFVISGISLYFLIAFRFVHRSVQMVMACHYILQPKTQCFLTSSTGGDLRDAGSYEWCLIRNRFQSQILNTSIILCKVSYKTGKQLFKCPSVWEVKPLGSRSRWSLLLLTSLMYSPVCLVLSSSPLHTSLHSLNPTYNPTHAHCGLSFSWVPQGVTYQAFAEGCYKWKFLPIFHPLC